jgi:hypothetical protein
MDRFILEIPNFLPPDLCKEIIDRFKSIEHTLERGILRYIIDENKYAEFKKPNLECNMSKDTLFRDLDSELSNRFTTACNMYLDHLDCEFDHNKKPLPHTFLEVLSINNMIDRGYLIHKIPPGSSYEWHVDNDPRSDEKSFIQFILYLNTLELDEGGTTEFANGRKVKPEVGKLLIFPCSWTFPHSGNEVKGKDKFIIATIFNV